LDRPVAVAATVGCRDLRQEFPMAIQQERRRRRRDQLRAPISPGGQPYDERQRYDCESPTPAKDIPLSLREGQKKGWRSDV
ncbi:MAG TPA: hypothetical protein VFG86_23400, partial [Chloroflexota bacterium]|nr:hypothetical protein [Chloroflexota bacterium]